MSAAPIFEAAEPVVDEVLVQPLRDVGRWMEQWVADREVPELVAQATRVDRIAQLERLQACLEAAKNVEIVAFARDRAVEQIALGVHPRRAEAGIGDEIALAMRVSPTEGSRRLHVAKDLVLDMPETLGLLAAGQINAGTARRIVEPLSHLDRGTRSHVDQVLSSKHLERKSPREAAAAAERAAYEADRVGSMNRACKARKDRRVTLRPAPDNMTVLNGLLPVEQGVACWAALKAAVTAAKAEGDERTRGQIMADTLVARLTGQEHADDVGFDVGLVFPVDALLDPEDPTPAELPGHGPLPAWLARELIENAKTRSWWRRLFVRPTHGGDRIVIDLDPKRRRFTGWLGELIRWRDWTCRDQFCDAPIRHLDHIQQRRHDGPTTQINGRGVCERGNYTRELPGWSVHLADPDDHTVVTTTPTGHTYTSNPPEPP
jgi:hypothetical protein